MRRGLAVYVAESRPNLPAANELSIPGSPVVQQVTGRLRQKLGVEFVGAQPRAWPATMLSHAEGRFRRGLRCD